MTMQAKGTRSGRWSVWMAAALVIVSGARLSAQSLPQGGASGPPVAAAIGGETGLGSSADVDLAGPMRADPPQFVGYCGGAIDVTERQHLAERMRLAWMVVLLRSGLHDQPGLTVSWLALSHAFAVGSVGGVTHG